MHDLEAYLEEAKPLVKGNPDELDNNDVDDDMFEFDVGKSICVVNLGNLDLGPIVDGLPGDPIELHQFSLWFTK